MKGQNKLFKCYSPHIIISLCLSTLSLVPIVISSSIFDLLFAEHKPVPYPTPIYTYTTDPSFSTQENIVEREDLTTTDPIEVDTYFPHNSGADEEPENGFAYTTTDSSFPRMPIVNYFPTDNCSRCDFSCQSKRLCIKRHLVCDGINDCDDGSDELSCPDIVSVINSTLDCMNGECPRSYKRNPGLCNCHWTNLVCSYQEGEAPLILFSTLSDVYEAKLPEYRLEIETNKRLHKSLDVISAFDCVSSKNDLLWLDKIENKIFRRDRKPDQNNLVRNQDRRLAAEDVEAINGFVFDWMTFRIIWITDFAIMSKMSEGGRYFENNYRYYRFFDRTHDKPGPLTIDVEKRFIFWINLGAIQSVSAKYIERIDLASNFATKKIVETKLLRPVGLAVDTESTKVYWIDGLYRTLNSVGYDGSNRVTLCESLPFINELISMDIFSNYLYFTDKTNSTIQRININNQICKVDTLLSVPDGPPTWIKIVDPNDQRRSLVETQISTISPIYYHDGPRQFD